MDQLSQDLPLVGKVCWAVGSYRSVLFPTLYQRPGGGFLHLMLRVFHSEVAGLVDVWR